MNLNFFFFFFFFCQLVVCMRGKESKHMIAVFSPFPKKDVCFHRSGEVLSLSFSF